MSETKPRRAVKPKAEWHLICVTRKGKVSMLQNLTLEVARETYKRLMPETHPEKYFPPKCIDAKPQPHGYGVQCKSHPHRHGYTTFGSGEERDRLERVDVVGPLGQKLNPWAGVKPREIRLHCHCKPSEKPAKRVGNPASYTRSRLTFRST